MAPLPLGPVALNQLPRPSAFIPNPAGSLALVSFSSYHHPIQSQKNYLVIIHLDPSIHPPHHIVSSDFVHDTFLWLDHLSVLCLRPPQSVPDQNDSRSDISSKLAKAELNHKLDALPLHAKNSIEIWVIHLHPDPLNHSLNHNLDRIGTLSNSISNLRFQPFINDQHLLGGTLAFTSSVYPPYDSGSFQKAAQLDHHFEHARQGSSAQVYDSLFVRHWDTWADSNRKQSRLFTIDLKFRDQRWLIDQDDHPRSLFPHWEIPVGPFGDLRDFDICPSSVVATSKDPNLNPAWHTRQNIYLVPLFPRNSQDAKPLELTPGDQGATSSPVFSPTAKASEERESGHLAWLEMKKDGYEADRNILVIYDLKLRKRTYLTEHWDRSPQSIVWGKNDHEIYLLAEEHGFVRLYSIEIQGLKATVPKLVFAPDYSIGNVKYLNSKDRLFLTTSSFRFPNRPVLIDPQGQPVWNWNDESLGSDDWFLDAGESFWFDGCPTSQKPVQKVHGFLIRPPGFQQGSRQKWPLLFLVHGGPQSAWNNSWSLRWNANTFASKGFIVSMINPTGSTGYGQDFTDSINQNWGGKPYKDLVAGYEYLLKNYPEIDERRTAALGASYGGYMVNWMMGHNHSPLNFKAFISHDGIFNTVSTYYSTEELYFPEFDHGGTPITKREEYERWNPMNFVSEWKTPCLVIHSQKDYRLPEAEGLSVFNALQRQGVPSRFLYFPDENHWVSNPSNSIFWYQEIFKFLDEWCPPGPRDLDKEH